MHSSTSSSEGSADLKIHDRALPGDCIRPAAWIGLLVMLVMMGGWEMYWRSQDAIPSYRNSDGLWAMQRIVPLPPAYGQMLLRPRGGRGQEQGDGGQQRRSHGGAPGWRLSTL